MKKINFEKQAILAILKDADIEVVDEGSSFSCGSEAVTVTFFENVRGCMAARIVHWDVDGEYVGEKVRPASGGLQSLGVETHVKWALVNDYILDAENYSADELASLIAAGYAV